MAWLRIQSIDFYTNPAFSVLSPTVSYIPPPLFPSLIRSDCTITVINISRHPDPRKSVCLINIFTIILRHLNLQFSWSTNPMPISCRKHCKFFIFFIRSKKNNMRKTKCIRVEWRCKLSSVCIKYYMATGRGHQGEGTLLTMIITDQFWECYSPVWPC